MFFIPLLFAFFSHATTLYDVLGVPENASISKIKQAYDKKENELRSQGRWMQNGFPTPEALEVTRAYHFLATNRKWYDQLSGADLYGNRSPLADPDFLHWLQSYHRVMNFWGSKSNRKYNFSEPEILFLWKGWVRSRFYEEQRKPAFKISGEGLSTAFGVGTLLGYLPAYFSPRPDAEATAALGIGVFAGIFLSAPLLITGNVAKWMASRELLRVFVTEKWGVEGALMAGLKPLYANDLSRSTRVLNKFHHAVWDHPYHLAFFSSFTSQCAVFLYMSL